DLLAEADRSELARILSRYGEERFAGRIAGAIVTERERQPITRSPRLLPIVRANIPQAARRSAANPAQPPSQPLRIAVNAELAVLQRAIPAAIDSLGVHGRLVVESYHSLEDRIVERALAAGARSAAPERLPVPLPEHEP